jgi:hypothetical protein
MHGLIRNITFHLPVRTIYSKNVIDVNDPFLLYPVIFTIIR